MTARKLKLSDVEFTIECEAETIPIRGNALASGDEAQDREAEQWIHDELERGNPWAWCCVVVRARLVVTATQKGRVPIDCTLEGIDSLGACSYASEADFMKSGYVDDMKAVALADIQAQVDALAPIVCGKGSRLATRRAAAPAPPPRVAATRAAWTAVGTTRTRDRFACRGRGRPRGDLGRGNRAARGPPP
jgi:hypothetical protein